MDKNKFKFWNRIVALTVFLVAAVTYLLTIEPTASFWDCGEFIASSYKLEVGHPPGNPVFQLFARCFSMAESPESAAVAINAMSALCSALTILLLYLTTVFLVKRLVKPSPDGTYSVARSIVIFASGALGALVYTFSDTFWFSAVEGEVYAMSSLFTALVFWAMTKWYEQADEPYANRWLVLIAFLMGLSIGIHLLNLLTIPALVFLFFYRKRETRSYSPLQMLAIFSISMAILAIILYVVIPYLPEVAALVDRVAVNKYGLPFNTGAAIFMILLLVLCFSMIFLGIKIKNAFLTTATLCFTMIVIGFSLFSIVIIRSSAKTPTNEYQPDNPYTLVRYLAREQYGSNPLIYGQAFDSPYDFDDKNYWAPSVKTDTNGNKTYSYVRAKAPSEPSFVSEGKMFFPRMWSSDERHKEFYLKNYVKNPQPKKYEYEDEYGITQVKRFIMPSFFDNLRYFSGYQMNWMYWRYFLWNFAGRQNDIHGQEPNSFFGNWESGIDFLDELRLGDQSDAPASLADNKGKNHYYMLPLLLGLIGFFFQIFRDGRGWWVTFLMFFMTGIAIVIYLNQTPYQARERDYAYAGSFYTFSIWIGLSVAALYALIKVAIKAMGAAPLNKYRDVTIASVLSLLTLSVPALMAVENWDDHDRSNRYTAVEVAKNYLNSVGPNGILITHGDNDTFPLWYAQEVEGIRTDVRVANTSLLGTDWHIDQMKWATNESSPLDLSLPYEAYLYGTNEYLYVDPYGEHDGEVIPLKQMMDDLRAGKYEIEVGEGEYVQYLPYSSYSIPVNKENVLNSGILALKYEDQIPSEITLTISGRYITKPELFMLDLLSNYQWDRPINILSMGGDINVGIKDYFMYEGFSYKFVPIKNKMSSSDIGFSDPDDLYYKMKNVFTWDALKRTDYFVDYQNMYTFCGVLSQRQIFVNVAKELVEDGQKDKALEILHMCEDCVPEENFPLDMTYLGFSNEYWVTEMIILYFTLGDDARAVSMTERFMQQLQQSKEFYAQFDELNHLYETANKYLNYMFVVCQDKIDEYMDAYPEDHDFRTAAKRLFRAYSRCLSLTDWPDDQMWLRYFMHASELNRKEQARPLIKPYADNLVEYMMLYEKKRAEALTQQARLEKDLETLGEMYTECYKLYGSLYEQYSNSPYNTRISSQIEACEEKLSNYEEQYYSKQQEIEEYELVAEEMVDRFWTTVDNMTSLYNIAKDTYHDAYAPKVIRDKLVEYWGEEGETLLYEY